ncbi:MAG TPA: hypothetical protein VI383_11180 [Gemmatimonadales bacterium]|nr:hypothetical protein [Gemmatimonadales bacterium]
MRIAVVGLLVGSILGAASCGGATNPDVPELRIVNHGATTITLVNIAACNDSEWGQNRAGLGIRSGQAREYQLNPGCWDFRVGGTVNGAVRTMERRGVLVQSGITHIWEVVI